MCNCSGDSSQVESQSGYTINGQWFPYDYTYVASNSLGYSNLYDHRTEVAIAHTDISYMEGEEEVSVFMVRIIRDGSKMTLTAKEINLLGFKVVAFDLPDTDEPDKLEQNIGEQ